MEAVQPPQLEEERRAGGQTANTGPGPRTSP